MRVWRIVKPRHAARALDGEGARLFGGRWNPRGCAVAYTSATLSLAALEYLVHLHTQQAPRLVAVEIDVPDDVAVGRIARLPRRWRDYPIPASTQRIGEAWVHAGRTAVLRAPSVVVPTEWNYLVNPAHPHAGRLRVVGRRPFAFDARLLRERR